MNWCIYIPLLDYEQLYFISLEMNIISRIFLFRGYMLKTGANNSILLEI